MKWTDWPSEWESEWTRMNHTIHPAQQLILNKILHCFAGVLNHSHLFRKSMMKVWVLQYVASGYLGLYIQYTELLNFLGERFFWEWRAYLTLLDSGSRDTDRKRGERDGHDTQQWSPGQESSDGHQLGSWGTLNFEFSSIIYTLQAKRRGCAGME